MVEVILKELETLKAKVEEAIAHVKAGVTTLNEEQIEKLHGLLSEIGMAAETADQNISHLITAAEVKVEAAGGAVKAEGESLLHKVEGIFEAVKEKAEEVLGIEPKTPPTVTLTVAQSCYPKLS